SRVGLGLTPTDSLVERFGLFTIIVLGELVIGVVDGLSGAERDAKTIITGMLALSMGFGFWWIYFDLVGHRLPRAERLALANWVMSHLPITLAITAAGGGVGRRGGDAPARARPGPHPADAGRRRTPVPGVPPPTSGAVRRGGGGPDRRLAATGPLAARVAAGGDALRGLGLRREPPPARRRPGGPLPAPPAAPPR